MSLFPSILEPITAGRFALAKWSENNWQWVRLHICWITISWATTTLSEVLKNKTSLLHFCLFFFLLTNPFKEQKSATHKSSLKFYEVIPCQWNNATIPFVKFPQSWAFRFFAITTVNSSLLWNYFHILPTHWCTFSCHCVAPGYVVSFFVSRHKDINCIRLWAAHTH